MRNGRAARRAPPAARFCAQEPCISPLAKPEQFDILLATQAAENRVPFDQLKRRKFLSLLASAVATWPIAVRAQQPGRLPTIGFIGPTTPRAHGSYMPAFVQRLHELGWIEGRTVAIERRWAEGRPERLAEIATELVRMRVDVIVAHGNQAALAAKQATSVIPIVFPLAGDPLGTGLVASLARPGGNVTGLSLQQKDTAGKRLELLREIVPGLRRLAILANSGNPGAALEIAEALEAARTLGLEVVTLEIRRAEDIGPAFEASKDRIDALYATGDPLIVNNIVRINTLALGAKLPTAYVSREYVEFGGLMSYGPSYPDLYRRAGEYVDKILRGTKPADIPVEQPTRFVLVVNLITAQALGITVPPMLLARADEVIE
jgi:putative ABC transport system substrate-binding protein